jgi:hypothetical protein
MCSFRVEKIAVFGLDDLLIFHIVESTEMFVVDVLDVDPLNKEKALELKRMIFPPEREGFLVVIGCKPGDSLEHA